MASLFVFCLLELSKDVFQLVGGPESQTSRRSMWTRQLFLGL